MNPKSAHIDAALTTFSVAYQPSGFIADVVAPVAKVDKENDKYYEWNRADTLRTYDDLRAAGAEAKVVDFGFSTQSYSCEEHTLKIAIPWRSIANADAALRLEQSKTKFLKNTLLNGRERRVAALFTNTATYAAGLSTTLSGTSQWNNGSYAGDPVREIDNAKEAVRAASGLIPNTIIFGPAVIPVLTNNSTFRDHYKYTANDIQGTGMPAVFRGMRVLIPGTSYNSANPGAAAAVADVWGKNVVLAYIDPSDDLETVTFCKRFTARKDQVRKWMDEDKESTIVEESVGIEDIKIVSNVAAYLIKNVIA